LLLCLLVLYMYLLFNDIVFILLLLNEGFKFAFSRFYEVAIIVNQRPENDKQIILLENARNLAARLTNEAPSHPIVSLWNPVFTFGCPHKSRRPLSQARDPTFKENWPYWRGIALAQKSIWEDFCVYRENVRPDDVIVILEHDAWCRVNACSQAVEIAVQLQNTDIKYLGWTKHREFVVNMHAYSITCAAVLKVRDKIDPCGSAMDLQIYRNANNGTLTWETAYAERNSFGINQTSYTVITTKTTHASADDGIFNQIKFYDGESEQHARPGEFKVEDGMKAFMNDTTLIREAEPVLYPINNTDVDSMILNTSSTMHNLRNQK
jgi:hypothetical protein